MVGNRRLLKVKELLAKMTTQWHRAGGPVFQFHAETIEKRDQLHLP